MWTVLERLGIPLDPSVTALWSTLPARRRFDRLGPHGRMLRIPAADADAAATIEAARPTILFTDPAGLCAWIRRPPRVRPAAVLSSASQLSPHVRATAENVLGTPIIDYWSTTETGPIAVSCGVGHHVLGDVIVEEDRGELLVTRIRPGATVVLRWRSGDRGRVVPRCPCGHSGPTLLDFQGRRAVWFSRPDGTAVDAWSMAPALKWADVLSFRLTQHGPSRFHLEMDDPSPMVAFEDALRELGWESPSIQVSPAPPAQSKPEPFRRIRGAGRLDTR
jgi:phenylacetate-CoA ligase